MARGFYQMLKVKMAVETLPARSAAMHRRGHDYYGTACPVRCDLVARWAARRLITPRAYLLAARASQDLDGMAALMGVTASDVCAYLASLDPDEWLIMQNMVGRRVTRRQ